MTKLLPGKSLKRETAGTDRRKPIVVVLHPRYLEVYPKGTRKPADRFTVDYETVLEVGRKIAYRRSGGRL